MDVFLFVSGVTDVLFNVNDSVYTVYFCVYTYQIHQLVEQSMMGRHQRARQDGRGEKKKGKGIWLLLNSLSHRSHSHEAKLQI